jgi:hypothetical protein
MKSINLRALKESICGKDDGVVSVSAGLANDFFSNSGSLNETHTVSRIANHTQLKKTPSIANMTSLRSAS